MAAINTDYLRKRSFSYFEVLSFAQFFADNRNSDSAHNLLLSFLRVKVSRQNTDLAMLIVLLIEYAVAQYYDLPIEAIRSKRRYTDLVKARQIIAYLSVKHSSQHNIATATGDNRNNIQARKSKCSLLMETEKHLVNEVAQLDEIIRPAIEQMKADYNEDAEKTIDPAYYLAAVNLLN